MTSSYKYAKNLKPGDLIGISYSHQIVLGIYRSLGSVNNLQYYPVHVWTMNSLKAQVKPRVAYINNSGTDRIVRINKEELDKEDLKLYEELKVALGFTN